MPKFRNPKTGEVYDINKSGCYRSGFCRNIECSECPIYARPGMDKCEDYVSNNPKKVAELMGYELVDEVKMPQKPMKDWTLQECRDYCMATRRKHNLLCDLHCDLVQTMICKELPSSWCVDPEFTAQEIEIAKILQSNGFQTLERDGDDDSIRAFRRNDISTHCWDLPAFFFPSIKLRWKISIEDITGERSA